MRNVFIFLAVFFILVAILFAVLPLGTLGFLPTGLALLFSILAFVITNGEARKFPKWLMVISFVILGVVIGKSFVKDEVAPDEQFEQQKIESQKEDLKDLEELDGREIVE